MSTKTMTVRNTCPFPIWFKAIGGPHLQMGPNETQSASACAIWFSTRVEGPGTVFWSEDWDSLKQTYKDNAAEFSGSATDWSDGGTGAYAGSCLGLATMALVELFKIHNCEELGSIYWGAKLEGVYGQCNLLVYATLDPACAATPDNPEKIWNLHLVRDSGQQSPGQTETDAVPVYAVPDLSDYSDTMFVRARNKALGSRMYAADDQAHVHVRAIDVPFDPFNFPEYWTVSPAETDGDDVNDLKILNVKTQKWLTQFSRDGGWLGLYGIGYADEQDQHWGVTVVSSIPTEVTLTNLETRALLVGQSNSEVVAVATGAKDTDVWVVETMTVDIDSVPAGGKFRLMQASTGKYLTGQNTSVPLESFSTNVHIQTWTLDRQPDGTSRLLMESIYSLRAALVYPEVLIRYYNQNPYVQPLPCDCWTFAIDSTRAGLRLRNMDPALGATNILTVRDGVFTLEADECPEQLFVAQLESIG